MPGSAEYEHIKSRLHHFLISKTDFLKVKDKLNDDQLRLYVDEAITVLSADTDVKVSFEERAKLIREVASAVVSLGPLRGLLEDHEVSEIMVNGYKSIYVQKGGKMFLTDVRFDSNEELQHTIQKMLAASGTSRRVDESSPYADFTLTDGSRVNVLLPPCSQVGPALTIRKFSRDITKVEDLVALKTLNKEMADFLLSAIKARLNIVFCGATGSGKTTLLNVFSRHIPEDERIITIEDTSELRLMQEHVVPLQAKAANVEGKGAVSIRDLFVNSLRMRPDRIIIGEVRGAEIIDMVQAISSGHSGTLAIIHADSPLECLNRMGTMMLMSGIQMSADQIQRQLGTSIDLIVYCELYLDGVRRVANIVDVSWDKDQNQIVPRDIFTFEQESVDASRRIVGGWAFNARPPSFANKYLKRNVPLPAGFVR